MLSRRKLAPKEAEEGGELNIVPYLDILMNLIIFMLLSMAGLATYGMVKATAPPVTPPGTGRQQESFGVTVAVARSGFFIEAPGEAGVTIPRAADGRYDFDALTQQMQELKAAFPRERRVVIAADPETPYDTLVATVDATRETPTRQALFPDVTLAQF